MKGTNAAVLALVFVSVSPSVTRASNAVPLVARASNAVPFVAQASTPAMGRSPSDRLPYGPASWQGRRSQVYSLDLGTARLGDLSDGLRPIAGVGTLRYVVNTPAKWPGTGAFSSISGAASGMASYGANSVGILRYGREVDAEVRITVPRVRVSRPHGTPGLARYTPTLSGSVQGFGLAGVEPDGDPLYKVVLQTRLTASGELPPVNLIVSSYLENFRPDTTPVLPDLLHPTQTAHNLGGFLQGKALLTDDAGDVLYLGDFLAEAFLDNTNHAAIHLFASHSYAGGGIVKGRFVLRKDGKLSGSLSGSIVLSPNARRQIDLHRGETMRPLQDIIKVVTVVPHYYGAHGVHGSGPALHTGFGGNQPASSSGGRHISPWTLAAAAGALLSLLMAGILYLLERRRATRTASLE